MGQSHTQRYCPTCEKKVRAVMQTPNHILHLLLSIVTGGLWLVVWILVALTPRAWRCTQCGATNLRWNAPKTREATSNTMPLRDRPVIKKNNELPNSFYFCLLIPLLGLFVILSGWANGSLPSMFGGVGIACAGGAVSTIIYMRHT